MPDSLGHAWLVGGGPGDPGLLTLAGASALATADVVIYDALVEPAILRHARPEAELIYAGKRAGQQELSQDAINALLVARTTAGQRVVRLKGGDPFVFGRGGEEALALRAAGAAYTIVPGVTSALAAPAYAGIPVTHRGLADSFVVLTGHSAEEREPRLQAAAEADTVVILMGRESLARTCERLMAAGKPATTPAACIRWGTRQDQEVVTGTLATIAGLAEAARLEAPVTTVVGPVAGLASTLDWFRPGPLANRRVVVTRARAQASGLAARLEALGARVIDAPVIETAPRTCDGVLASALRNPAQWIAFTSAAAVRACRDALAAEGRDSRAFAPFRIAAVGEATAAELATLGLRADFVPSRAEGVCLAAELPANPGETVLFPASSLANDAFASGLRERGIAVERVTAYDTVPGQLDAQAVGDVLEADAITFTSASTVSNLRACLPEGAIPGGTRLVSIGEQTSAALRSAFGRVDSQAGTPSLDALVAATVEALSR